MTRPLDPVRQNRTRAARILGISRDQFHRLMKEFRRKMATDLRKLSKTRGQESRRESYRDMRVATSLHSPKPSTPRARI